jgi:hypothetical protein
MSSLTHGYRMTPRSIALAALLLALPACSIFEPEADERDRLIEARSRWNAQVSDDYTFRLERGSCECLPEWLHPLRIEVRSGVVVEVEDLETGTTAATDGRARTVVDLFEWVEHLIGIDAYRLTVEYDPQLGYPTFISWDEDVQVADDEGTYTASDLEPLGLSLLGPSSDRP